RVLFYSISHLYQTSPLFPYTTLFRSPHHCASVVKLFYNCVLTMSEITNSPLNEQIYKLHTGENLLSQIAKVVIVLMPRGIAVAGFSDRGDLLMIKNNEYKKALPQWIIDFFEHQFLNDQMLSAPHRVTSVFIATEKTMLTPEVLYKPADAEAWLKKLYHVESNEIITTHHLREDKAYYLYAWP